jgi:hypothetical protein
MFVPVNWQLESSVYPAEDEATMQWWNSDETPKFWDGNPLFEDPNNPIS